MYKLTFTDEYGHIAHDNNRAMFRINQKKRKIACILHATVEGFNEHYAYKSIHYNWDLDSYISKRLHDYNITRKNKNLNGEIFTFIGIATCDETDEFNEEIGKHIAETRARKQVYYLMELINKFTKEYINIMNDNLNKAIEKTNFLKSREDDHEKKLVCSTINPVKYNETN